MSKSDSEQWVTGDETAAEGGDTESAILTDDEFEALVEQAIDSIPEELMAGVENCAFVIEHEPPHGQEGLLGLYEGQPLTDRIDYSGVLPDTITIYQGPLQRSFPDPQTLREEIYTTVVHEIGHYFGIEEEDLHRLGWG